MAAEDPQYAFQCRNCDTLEGPEFAGDDRAVPAACRVCGKGITRDPNTGAWSSDPENWIVLADLDSSEQSDLAEKRGLLKKQIVAHKADRTIEPPGVGHERLASLGHKVELAGAAPRHVAAEAEESVGSEDAS